MIAFENVSVKFRQNKKVVEAVNNVSFQIDDGDVFGIVGGSGAGKSTLLRTINQLQTVSEGNVAVDGRTINNLKGSDLKTLRQNIGMIFQHFNLAENKTVYQNIEFVLKVAGWPKNKIKERITELLEFVKLSDKADTYPSKLSGGQKQRVSIARALANNTKILFGVLIPEAMPSIIKNITVTAISVLGFSAMAGLVGGGGLGDLAYRYGYQRFQTDIMVVCVFLLVLIVQIIQLTGDAIAVKFDKKH